MKYLVFFSVVFLYMLGGQVNKAFRRFALPALLIPKSVEKKSWKPLAGALSFMAVLSMGYGQDSKFFSILKMDWLVRLFYSLLVCAAGWFTQCVWYLPVCILVVVSFQLRLGGFKVFKWDFLWEDFFRASTIGLFFIL